MEQFDGSNVGVAECDHGGYLQLYTEKMSDGSVLFIGCCTKCGFYGEITSRYLDEVFSDV